MLEWLVLVLCVSFGIGVCDDVVLWLYIVFMACLLCLMCGHCFAGLGLYDGLGMCAVWS